jgi:hypothetical protein
VLTSTGRQGAATKDSSRSDALQLEPYEHPELLAAMEQRRSGYVEIRQGDSWRFIGYEFLPTLGWTYVEEIDAHALLGSPE